MDILELFLRSKNLHLRDLSTQTQTEKPKQTNINLLLLLPNMSQKLKNRMRKEL